MQFGWLNTPMHLEHKFRWTFIWSNATQLVWRWPSCHIWSYTSKRHKYLLNLEVERVQTLHTSSLLHTWLSNGTLTSVKWGKLSYATIHFPNSEWCWDNTSDGLWWLDQNAMYSFYTCSELHSVWTLEASLKANNITKLPDRNTHSEDKHSKSWLKVFSC